MSDETTDERGHRRSRMTETSEPEPPIRTADRRSRSTAPSARSTQKGDLVIKACRGRRRVHPALLLPPADEVGRDVPAVSRRGRHGSPRHRCSNVSCMITVTSDGHGGRHDDIRRRRSAPRRASSNCCSRTIRSTARSATRAGSARCRTRRSVTVPARSRYVEEKRHYEKPIPISDLVLPRSRTLHSVRSMHPLRRRGRRRQADPLHPAAATRRR